MEGQSRSSHKYLVLQVWCCLLTLSMVGMAAFLATGKTTPAEVSAAATDYLDSDSHRLINK